MDSQKAHELFQAQAHLYRHMFLYLSSFSLKCAIELGIPDIIHAHARPVTLSHLASALNIPPSKAPCIQRLMRLLAHNGFFTITKSQTNEDAYDLTPPSELLVNGSNHCHSLVFLFGLDPALVDMFHYLGKWVRGQDRTLPETAFGLGFWEFLNKDEGRLRRFNESMASDSLMTSLVLREMVSVFEGVGSVVDVGGGTGTTAKIICDAFPELKCTVLDRPEIVVDLCGNDKFSYVGGDMFDSIPNADAVLLKWVLHDWGDDDCIKILKKSKEAISGKGNGGKVVIIDIVINEEQDEHEMTETKLLNDIAMMAAFNAKERTETEWKHLFVQAGFANYHIFPIFGFRSLIVLYP